jgi:hypothetical protein
VKACTTCGVLKPLSDYGLQPKAPDGRRTQCRSCVRAKKLSTKKLSRVFYRPQDKDTIFDHLEKDANGHWKYVGPSGRGRFTAPETWCAIDIGYPCLNPDHQMSPGSLPLVELEQIDADDVDGRLLWEGFNVAGGPNDHRKDYKKLEQISADDRYLLQAPNRPANVYLKRHGFNVRGESFKRKQRGRQEGNIDSN